MHRRAFLLLSAAGTVLSRILGSEDAHGAVRIAPNQEPASAVSSGRAIDVASVAELNRTNQLLVRSSPLGPVLVIRDPGTKQLQAVDPTCPHRGCTVAWNAGMDSFLCPCHQARFQASGRWIGGQPVKRPLQRYRVRVSKGRILVSQT